MLDSSARIVCCLAEGYLEKAMLHPPTLYQLRLGQSRLVLLHPIHTFRAGPDASFVNRCQRPLRWSTTFESRSAAPTTV